MTQQRLRFAKLRGISKLQHHRRLLLSERRRYWALSRTTATRAAQKVKSRLEVAYLDRLEEELRQEYPDLLIERDRRFGPYYVDGYYVLPATEETPATATRRRVAARPEERHVVEVFGCRYHGHEHAAPDENAFLFTPSSDYRSCNVRFIRQRDAARRRYFEARKFKYTVVWECESGMNPLQDEYRAYVRYLRDGEVDIRKTFFGGRTETFATHFKCTYSQKLAYVDFCR